MTNTIYRGSGGRVSPTLAREIATKLYEDLAGETAPAWEVVTALNAYVAQGNRLGFRSSPVTRGDLLDILDQHKARE